MPNTLAQPYQTRPDKADVTGRKRMAHADLHDNAGQDPLSDVVLDAAKKTFGKQGAAAAHLGKDEGNFSRDTKALRTTLEHLRDLGPSFLAQFGRGLVNQYGELADPHDYADRVLLEIDRLVVELKQYVASRRIA
jgi:hypothetical protein